ncbi:unnamed protein product, partial [Mesorhabditis belari]|uniref:Nucleotide-diphospho-sugar transferase domain-containing protein n=1 Tax=Mesorhabditis belari TaxID=2138241 RepID=A0AAF3EWE0_9BILA
MSWHFFDSHFQNQQKQETQNDANLDLKCPSRPSPESDPQSPSRIPPQFIPYPRRQNMSHCVPTFGKINIFIAYKAGALKDHYHVALSSWRCYLKSTNYTLVLVDVDNDPRVTSKCSQYKEFMFLRHCALLQYMSEADWTIAMDADTGVINPEHCIEEYIDPRVPLIFHQRFHNYEIAADTFIVKNSTFARNFIKEWADWDFRRPKLQFDNRDNGALHIANGKRTEKAASKHGWMQLLETIFNETAPNAVEMCREIWVTHTIDIWSYFAMVQCAKMMMGANRFWPGKLLIYPKGEGMTRDDWITNDHGTKFSDRDFLFHAWKHQSVTPTSAYSFEKIPDVDKCGVGTLEGWYWRNGTRVSEKELLDLLLKSETYHMKWPVEPRQHQKARVIPWFEVSELKRCHPNCMDRTKL